MDGHRFDAIARAWAVPATRRRLLGLAVGAGLLGPVRRFGMGAGRPEWMDAADAADAACATDPDPAYDAECGYRPCGDGAICVRTTAGAWRCVAPFTIGVPRRGPLSRRRRLWPGGDLRSARGMLPSGPRGAPTLPATLRRPGDDPGPADANAEPGRASGGAGGGRRLVRRPPGCRVRHRAVRVGLPRRGGERTTLRAVVRVRRILLRRAAVRRRRRVPPLPGMRADR